MFRVVPPPIIRSANSCIYSIWYLSHRYCYLLLSWNSWNWFECAVLCCRWRAPPTTQFQHCSNSSTIAADSSNGVTNTRWCRYSCLRSWWWVEVPPETCRAVSRKINCVTLRLVGCVLQYYNMKKFTHTKYQHQVISLFFFFVNWNSETLLGSNSSYCWKKHNWEICQFHIKKRHFIRHYYLSEA